MLAVVGAMRPDDPDMVPSVIFGNITECLADFLAAALLTIFSCADVNQLGRCVFFFAHRWRAQVKQREASIICSADVLGQNYRRLCRVKAAGSIDTKKAATLVTA